jgi:hypothetical protein
MSYNLKITPKVFERTVGTNSTFGSANLIAFDGLATEFQVSNDAGSGTIRVRLNGDSGADFWLPHGTSQSFSTMHITSVDFQNIVSGNGSTDVTVIVGLVKP